MLLSAILLFTVSCSTKPTPEQSEKLIRASDAEIISIANRFSETHGFRALMKAYQLPGIDLPFKPDQDLIETFDHGADDSHSHFAHYRADTTDEGYISVTFPYRFKADTMATLTLLAWETQPSLLLDDFPVAFALTISTQSGVRILDINYTAKLKHSLPESFHFSATTGGFKVKSELTTSFRKKNSNMRVLTTLEENGQLKMEIVARSLVEMTSDMRLLFGRKHISFKVFPILVDMRGERGFNTYNPLHFVRDFNADNHIAIYDEQMNLLGRIELSEQPGKDYANPVVRLDENTEIEVEQLMRSVKQLLRFKLRNF